MRFIGITGGVGAGKSEIIDYLEKKPRILVKKADLLAKELTENDPYVKDGLISLAGESLFKQDGSIDRDRMAGIIFKDPSFLEKVNGLVHPAVKEKILKIRDEAEASGKYDIFFIEAALLIECGYDKICDELWYIYADRDIRIDRLKDARGYSREKAESIINNQLPEEVFKKYCSRIIDNSGELENSFKEADRIISGYTS